MQSSLKLRKHTTTHRVTYSATDTTHFLHHSNYVRIYENARWELFRSLNIPYKMIEDQDILMPVIHLDLKFIKPAYYDTKLRIETMISDLTNTKITFYHSMYNEDNSLINEASITLAFIKEASGKAIRIPEFIKEILIDIPELVNSL